MKSVATSLYLQHSFAAYDLDWLWLQENLQLDLAYIQLLRDFQANWAEPDPGLLLTLLFLVDAVNQGSLCLLLDDEKLNNQAKSAGLKDLRAYLESLNLSHFKLASKTILVIDDGRLYFQKHHHQQTLLQQTLSTLITENKSKKFNHKAIRLHVDEVVNSLPYQLESQQIQALLTSVLQPFSIISGGPGTGKTTILLSLLKVLIRLGIPIQQLALAAPTGRAANRMTESIELGLVGSGKIGENSHVNETAVAATTIHRLLGSNPQKVQNRFHAHNFLPYQVVIVDEVSMVDLELMNQLVQAIGPNTRLIFLGDQFQLPSVKSGALLADLMPPVGNEGLNTAEFLNTLVNLWPSRSAPIGAQLTTEKVQLLTDKVTVLKTSKRCQFHIAKLSELVRQGEADMFIGQVKLLKKHQFTTGPQREQIHGVSWFSHVNEQTNYTDLYKAWFLYHYSGQLNDHDGFVDLVQKLRFYQTKEGEILPENLKDIFGLIKSQRILTLTHAGHNGTEYINGLMSGWLKKALQIETRNDCFHGAVIMIQRNDSSLDLYNGDVGLIIEVAANQFQVYFETHDSLKAFSVHLIPDYTLAFSITVHKSQGSEFEHVLIPLSEQLENPLLTREIIYTGMTRAKQSVCICGSQASLERAITRKTTRNSGLRFWSASDQ